MAQIVTESFPAFIKSAGLYDEIYRTRGKDYAGEVAYLSRLIETRKQSSGVSLLDVACGTGEHLRHFRDNAGYEILGIDNSPEMLAIARDKLDDVAHSSDSVVARADMIDFNLSRTFDVISCLFASISYLPDVTALRAAIGCMNRHLDPHGLLLIEPGLMPHQVEPPRKDQTSCRVGQADIRRTTTAQLLDDQLVIRFDFDIHSPQVRSGFSEEHVIRLFTSKEYEQAFKSAGLVVEYDPVGPGGRGLFIGTPA